MHRIKSLLFISLLSVSAVMANNSVAPDSGVNITTILETTRSWDAEQLPDNTQVSIKKFTIAPGAETIIHNHPINGGGYILDGFLTMYVTSDPSGDFSDLSKVKKVTYGPGETWAETINTWHYGTNYGDQPVHFIVTFIGGKDIPATNPLPQK